MYEWTSEWIFENERKCMTMKVWVWSPELSRGVNPYEKSCDFYKVFCVHSYSTKEAKVDKGVHLFF